MSDSKGDIGSEKNIITGAHATIPTISFDSSNSNHQRKKRKKRNPYGNLKKKKSDAARNIGSYRGTWREQKPDELKLPHNGSYAAENMQQLFGVSLPDNLPDEIKVTKRKVALLIAYLGTNYSGFQINENQKTVQAEIELALYKARFVQKSNFGFPHKYSWSTSGRTDKGVHACAQVCSMKLEIGEMTGEEVIKRINSVLPKDIIVLDVKRTTRNFCAKTGRSRVRYQYMIPSYIFFPEAKRMFEESGIDATRSPSDPITDDEVKALRAKLKNYRVTSGQLQSLQCALKLYNGTHAYHNFTRRMNPGDKAASRYIIEFVAKAPVIREDGTEWIPTLVLGQAFLLNQIRKMVALACDVVSHRATLDTMKYALSKDAKLRLPTAPAEGLFLDMSVYDGYNERKNRTSDLAEDLDWINEEGSPVMQKWRTFKESVVQQKIVDQEAEEGNFIKYLYARINIFDSDVACKTRDDRK